MGAYVRTPAFYAERIAYAGPTRATSKSDPNYMRTEAAQLPASSPMCPALPTPMPTTPDWHGDIILMVNSGRSH